MNILLSIFDPNKISFVYIVSQIFGLLGITSSIILYQQRTRKGILIGKLSADVIWVLNYIFVGGYTGAAVSCVALTREIVFYYYYKKGRKAPVAWLIVFLCAGMSCSVLTWKNMFSILPSISSVLSIISFWQSNPKRTIYFSFPIAISQLIYQTSCMNIMGMINEILTLSSSTVNLIRQKKTLKKEEQK